MSHTGNSSVSIQFSRLITFIWTFSFYLKPSKSPVRIEEWFLFTEISSSFLSLILMLSISLLISSVLFYVHILVFQFSLLSYVSNVEILWTSSILLLWVPNLKLLVPVLETFITKDYLFYPLAQVEPILWKLFCPWNPANGQIVL